MKTALSFIGALLVLTGLVWILQGANILPGSFMTGQIEWLIIGIFTAILGGGMIYFARRPSRT